MTVTIVSGHVPFNDPNPPPEKHTFAELIAGREDEFPTLARALREQGEVLSLKHEWMVGDDVWENYQQIVRFPYDGEPVEQGSMRDPGPTTKSEALTQLLAAIESILVDGKPWCDTKSGRPRSSCGGYRHYLGRDLRDGDKLSLRPLRAPTFRRWTHTGYDRDDGPVPMDRPREEWLAEFTLQVIPGNA